MPISVRKSADRYYSDYGWLKTSHTFSFGCYDDPEFNDFYSLTVLNEDKVAPGTGFPIRTHQNMEIFTIVLEGQLAHQDDLGNDSIIRERQVQLISAGTGITHTELNASDQKKVIFLQVWIHPKQLNLNPTYRKKTVSSKNEKNKWELILSPDGRDDSLIIHQDVDVFQSELEVGEHLKYDFPKKSSGWLQIISGEIELRGIPLNAGDGIGIRDTDSIHIEANSLAQVLLIVFYSQI